VLKKSIPDVKISPINEVEDSEENWRADEKEPIDASVLVVPRRVLLIGDGRLTSTPF
jgi:hypothetical protein